MTNETKNALETAQLAIATAQKHVAYLHARVEKVDRDEVERQNAHAREIAGLNSAFVLATIQDVPVPITFFKPWASVPVIKQWRGEGHLPSLAVRNGRLTCLPSEFFNHFRTLKDDTQRGKNQHTSAL